ncbi:MAG: hypothetical protein A3G29_13610 [Burkholderiales bacterium RIFCSPLOWO2_12_FULL_64_99]|jgi:uncharacterized membrane protein|uniref:DUF2061 domain-containing protein n=1 Tax=Aquabacterium sp. TaxID=1872578 RepID=UPI0008C6399C|nr:DUF2061 domain-containing protein [Aquabacterium sp.]OGB03832.1 MAG: hypothetical protein A3E52_16130 [Burkholderiales bacterium RIFCSPHIGHO2_12_FULL_63_20]OGB67363.1 MAG: hypothetical protein A3G29_13610 [Burkholderiales bacterium RIFCSPLOWO2_12_FULL_64_99]
MAKSATFGVMHVITAFSVTYAMTGSLTVAGVVTLVEPIVNTVMHYFFDKYWDHPRAQATRQAIARVAQQAVPHTPHRTRQQEGPEAGRAVGA